MRLRWKQKNLLFKKRRARERIWKWWRWWGRWWWLNKTRTTLVVCVWDEFRKWGATGRRQKKILVFKFFRLCIIQVDTHTVGGFQEVIDRHPLSGIRGRGCRPYMRNYTPFKTTCPFLPFGFQGEGCIYLVIEAARSNKKRTFLGVFKKENQTSFR
jgi:hypothetical protein